MAKILNIITGGGQQTATQNSADIIERIVDRVRTATLIDDRRDAVRTLKSLSKKFRVEVGTQAMDVLLRVLQQDRSDSEIVKFALETLYNVMNDEVSEEQQGAVVPNELAVQFTEIFIKDPDNVALLINLIEDFDFHIRWPGVRLLTTLLTNKCKEVQEICLVVPRGVSVVMDLLLDTREVVRNDAILLLTHLSKDNPNIQKIVAFENGFERILQIVEDEGGSEGGIIVEDCLQLLSNLLKHNTSNQNFFKEGSYIQRLFPFLDQKHLEGSTEQGWHRQKVNNVHLMLQVVRCLVSPSNPQQTTQSCQRAMFQSGLLQQLCGILMASGVPADILTEAVNTVAEVIRGNQTNQEYFSSVMAPVQPPRAVIEVLLSTMVNERQPFVLRCAVMYSIQSYLYRNERGKAQVVSSLLPKQNEDVRRNSTGQLLCLGMFSSDSLSNWLAAVALSHALLDNNSHKEMLLKVLLAININAPPVTLMDQLLASLKQETRFQTRLGYLMLLSHWLANCPAAVAQFLASSQAPISFLVSLASAMDSHDESYKVIQGVSCFLLGLCLLFNNNQVDNYSEVKLREILIRRVGVETLTDCLETVSRQEVYTNAAKKPQLKYREASEVVFDFEYTRLYKSLESNILKAVSTEGAPKRDTIEQHENIVSQYKQLIKEQDDQLHVLRKELKQLRTEHCQTQERCKELDEHVQQLRDQNAVLRAADGDDAIRQELLQLQIENEALKREEGSRETQEQQTDSTQDSAEQVQSLLQRIAQLEQDLAAAHAQLEEKPTNDQGLDNEMKKLQEENRRLNGDLDTIRKEQDDLLVLLSDQDGKIKTLKTRLKELGQEVKDEDDELDLDSEAEEETS